MKAAPKPCRYPGCAATVASSGFCDLHLATLRRRDDERRGSSSARGYDRDWRKLRAAFLRAHPLCECEDCEAGAKRLTPATVVDHVESIADRPELRLDWSNLRAMSKPCHDRRTARDQAWGRGAAGRREDSGMIADDERRSRQDG